MLEIVKCIMKKRILHWLTLFLIQICVIKLLNGEDLKKEENDENIFVFPSMQMEGIAAASSHRC